MSAFFFMFGNPSRRRWEDARAYGFVSAGGGKRWSSPLDRLAPGDEVFVRVPDKGYVGIGTVLAERTPITDFKVEYDGVSRPLLEAPLISPGLDRHLGDPERMEYVVPVRWQSTVPEARAYTRPHLFSKRTTVWPLDDESAVAEIRSALGA